MKYLYIGCGILAIILTFCLIVSGQLNKRTDAASAMLHEALSASERGNTEEAERAARNACAKWDEWSGLFGAFLCHDETDEINLTFSELLNYTAREDATEFQTRCARLLTMLEHIGAMDRPLSYNIL